MKRLKEVKTMSYSTLREWTETLIKEDGKYIDETSFFAIRLLSLSEAFQFETLRPIYPWTENIISLYTKYEDQTVWFEERLSDMKKTIIKKEEELETANKIIQSLRDELNLTKMR